MKTKIMAVADEGRGAMSNLDGPAKMVACPICEVAAGEVCVAAWGRSGPVEHAHEKRIELAKRSERGAAALKE